MLGHTLFTLIAALGLFSSSALAQTQNPNECTPSDSLQCVLCGNPNSSGNICTAYNATFDDLTTKRFTTYNLATWTGFTAVGYGHANPILPASRPRQARSTTGTGLIDFTDSGQLASLRTFSYGCATPAGRSRASDAVACNVTITATALQFLDGGGVGSFQYEGTFSYEPVPSGVGRFVAMEDGDWVSVSGTVTVAPGANPFYVFNYTFSATGADSSPVFLYLDDVVYSALCIGCGP